MPTALAARTKADRRPATAGTAAHARAPTRGLPLEGMTQLSISALSPADVLYLQRCAGNEAVCALMNRCPDDAPVQRKGPAASPAAKPKTPPFPFAPGCDLKIPIEGSAPGLVTKAAKDVEDIEWIDGVKTGDPPLPEQIDLTFQASSEAQASKTVRAQWEKKIVACETAEKTRLAKVSATGLGTPTHDADVKTAETASQAKIAELRKNLETLVASTEAKYESGRDNNRRVFMETMNCYLGSNAATKDHFQNLVQVSEFPGGPWLYKDAAEALKGVAKDMGGKEHYVKSADLPKAQDSLAALEKQIATLPKSGGDPKQRQALEAKRAAAEKTTQELEAARDAIPGLLATAFGPWLKQITTRITEIEKIGIEAKTAGVVIDNLPKKSSLDSAATILPKMAAIEQKIADAEAKAKEPPPAPAPAAKGSKAKPKKAPARPPIEAWK